MKRLLFAAVAASAFVGAVHAGEFTCVLTDQRGNALAYTFRTTSTNANQELGFMRNGVAVPNNHDAGRKPSREGKPGSLGPGCKPGRWPTSYHHGQHGLDAG